MATSRPKDIEPEHLRFRFLLRHVDDEPSIADARSLTQAIRKIIQTAANFAVVGEVDGASRLLEILKSRGIDPFQYSDSDYPFLKPCMFFAWEATPSWPSWIPEEERTEEKLQELEWGLISWTAWDFTVCPSNGIRDFLEQMAEASLRQERPWLNMFEPRFRKLANA
ncbi:hypothetical protein FCOIX_1493 [Fusarium coicis]|nr:hypothetical protein FCOIX_1493 [Fusarium coicis]